VETLNRVLRHLGLGDWDWSGVNLSEVFSGEDREEMPRRARDFLRAYYAESNRMLAEIMEPLPAWALPAPTLRVA
jgi:hypothetical protein